MNNFQHLVHDKEGAIAQIRLNRPDAANGLDGRMSAGLKQRVRLCYSDAEVKAVVLSARESGPLSKSANPGSVRP